MEWRRGDHRVSDERAQLDRAAVHRFLAEESYWAAGIPQGVMDKAIDHSLCFGLYRGETQIGFARVVTDHATFGYLCDVFVETGHRGAGLGKWLVSCVLAHPSLQGLRRLSLMTRDAHELYALHGFRPMKDPTLYLEIHQPDVYRSARGGSP